MRLEDMLLMMSSGSLCDAENLWKLTEGVSMGPRPHGLLKNTVGTEYSQRIYSKSLREQA
jgi:hypothetical protein